MGELDQDGSGGATSPSKQEGASPRGVKKGEASLPESVTFNAHIQPILSEKCYHCHGPDSGTREPKKFPLRLDRAQFAFEARENGKPVILKGKPSESLLVDLLKTSDPDEVMPPQKSHKTMSEYEIALIEKWIQQGAEYQEHWAYLSVKRPDAPSVQRKQWVKNPIDSFILSKIEKMGWVPNPKQDPARLLRRLTFDLIGLPPTPDELKRFIAEYAEDEDRAVEAVVDRLFKSSAYGEQQGRLWLDAARYADTHGIHVDSYREMWPYRDWVVRAFNQNMPFDQFTIEQLAGDMLPDADLDQKVASGFNRCLPTTGEGGSIVEEVKAMYATDRVNTTFGVWQGVTVGCAQCHDHKFDPITQKEFYQISAFFRNTTMSALDRNAGRHPPSVFVPRPSDRKQLSEMAAELKSLDKTVKAKRKERQRERDVEFQTWLKNQKKNLSEVVQPPALKGKVLSLPLVNPSGATLSGVALGKKVSWDHSVKTLPGVFGEALQVGPGSDSLLDLELGDYGDFGGENGFSYGGYLYIEGKASGAVIARMDPTDNHRGWDLWLEGGQVGAHVIEEWPKVAVKGVTKKALTPKEWHHVWIVFNPKKKKKSLTVYLDGRSADITLSHNSLLKNIHTKVPLRLGVRAANGSRLRGVVAVQKLQVVNRPMSPSEVRKMVTNSLVSSAYLASKGNAMESVLKRQFDTIQPPEPTPEQSKIDQLTKESDQLKRRGSYSLIMEENPKSQPFAYVLERGNYATKGEKVSAGTPAVLPPMREGMPANRLGLARWLVDAENPLTARVTVNRYWQLLFGRGIVETTEDFGVMGARPSHPELLDWLASEFVSSGWDVQHLLRLMVTSSTYRQSARVDADKLVADPLNEWFARSPRFRLHGEQLRDMALAASGLLVNELGGAPVKPYQPDGIWSSVAMKQSNTRNYKRDSGSKLYRRSLYTFWKRTAPPPSMELLNAPSRDAFCVRRQLTNTPLAAFVTMNDVQFVEAARVLAEKAMHASEDDASRIDYITLRLLSRTLNPDEKRIATATLKKSMQAFASSPEQAGKLIAVGDAPTDASLSPVQLAAWTMLASEIANLDEALTH